MADKCKYNGQSNSCEALKVAYRCERDAAITESENDLLRLINRNYERCFKELYPMMSDAEKEVYDRWQEQTRTDARKMKDGTDA